jgi:hypothetical protein
MRARAYRDALGAINALIGRACGPGLLALFLGLPLALCWARRFLKTELPRSCELLRLLCDHRRIEAHRDGKAGFHYQSPHREPHGLLSFNPFDGLTSWDVRPHFRLLAFLSGRVRFSLPRLLLFLAGSILFGFARLILPLARRIFLRC